MTLRTSAGQFSRILGQVDGLLAAPYGYTISVWTAGATALAHFGMPSLADILAFALGAVGAFLVMAFWGRRYVGQEVPGHVPSIIIANGVALIVAVVVSMVCTLLPWPLGRPPSPTVGR